MRKCSAVAFAVFVASLTPGVARAQNSAHEATEALWEAMLAFNSPDVPRAKLLEKCEAVAKKFPDFEGGQRAKAMAVILEKMIAEDEDYDRRKTKANADAKPSFEKQIAEAIFQLRDQHGEEAMWGSSDIFGDYGNYHDKDAAAGKSAAHRLVGFGYAAVPQLIAALDDKRFCRCVQFGGGGKRGLSHPEDVLRVGDCAGAVLERIAGVTFGLNTMQDSGNALGVKSIVMAWWQEFQIKGEKQQIIDAVVGGKAHHRQIERLIWKYPSVAFESIAQGLTNADSGWSRTEGINNLCQLDAKRAEPILMMEMKGPFLYSRIQAATQLLKQGNMIAVPALIGEWTKFNAELHGDRESTDLSSLVTALSMTGSKEAVEAIATAWPHLAVRQRNQIVGILGVAYKDARGQEFSADVYNAVGDFLLAATKDREELLGHTIGNDDHSVRDPRICDFAAKWLAKRCGQSDKFNFFGSLLERNRQLIDVQNAWLALRGKPAVPVPTLPKVRALPYYEVQPLVKRILSEPDAKARAVKCAALEKLGLAALPEVLKGLDDCDTYFPPRTDLAALTVRLACLVEDVMIVENSAKPTKKLQGFLDGMVGKSLTTKSLHELLACAYGEPKRYDAVRVLIYREESGDGLRMEVFLAEPRDLPKGKAEVQLQPFYIMVDDHRSSSGSNATFNVGSPFAAFSPRQIEELEVALKGSPGKAIRLHVGWRTTGAPPGQAK